MDFCCLKIRDKPHAPTTHIGKTKSNNNIKNNDNNNNNNSSSNNNNKITKQQYNSIVEHLVRCMHLLRIKRQLQNYFTKITYDSKAVCFNGSIMKLM